MSVEEGDELGWVEETNGQDELLLVTHNGKAIRFSEEDVRPMGLTAAGVWAVKLAVKDAVVGMGVVRDDAFVITMTEKGYAKRTAAKSFPAQKRYGGGVQATKLSSRTGPVAVAALADLRREVVLTTSKGRVTKLPVKAINSMGRAAAGNKARTDTKDIFVDPAKQGIPALLTVLAGTKTAAKRARSKKETGSSAKGQKSSTTKARKASSKRATKKASSGRGRSKAKKEAPAQLPLPMQSAPAKMGRKTGSSKTKSVRSVPKS
jgi:hypothetical protein